MTNTIHGDATQGMIAQRTHSGMGDACRKFSVQYAIPSKTTCHKKGLDSFCTVGIIAGASDICSTSCAAHKWSKGLKEWQGRNGSSLSVRLPSMVKVFPLPVAPLQSPQDYPAFNFNGQLHQQTLMVPCSLVYCKYSKQLPMILRQTTVMSCKP